MIHAQYEPLANLWGIPVSEVPKYLAIEKNLIMISSILKSILDNLNFGGTYINVPENQVFINTINSSMIPIVESNPKIKSYINLLSFKNATNSSHKLNVTFNELTLFLQTLNTTNVTIGISPIINNIVIYLYYEDDPVNKKFIEKAKEFYPIIKYSQPNSANSTKLKSKFKKRVIENLILGGDGLHNIDGSLRCSAGLWVQDENNVDYLLTAGHCYQDSPLNPSGYVDFYLQGWYSQPTYNYIGPLVYYSSVIHDFGLIRHVNTNSTLTTMIDNSDNTNLYKHLLIEESSDVDDAGAHVCKSGFTTHVVCGEVTETNVESSFKASNGRTYITREMIRTDIINMGGDSGGPVFSYSPIKLPYVSVVGITIAGDESKTDYIPLSVILRITKLSYNLSIIVTPQ